MITTTRHETFAGAKRRKAARLGWKMVRDAIIALAVFPILALTAGSGQIHAGPTSLSAAHSVMPNRQAIPALGEESQAPVVQIATVAASDQGVAAYRRTSFSAAWILLAASFSLIVALNLAVARHLRQAYLPRRRRSSAQ